MVKISYDVKQMKDGKSRTAVIKKNNYEISKRKQFISILI
jgi:hypothetical protein